MVVMTTILILYTLLHRIFFGLRVLRAVEVMPNADFDIDLSVTGKCEPLVPPYLTQMYLQR